MYDREQLLRVASLLAEKYELRARSWFVRNGISIDFFVDNIDVIYNKNPQNTLIVKVSVIADPPWDKIISRYIEKNIISEIERILKKNQRQNTR